MWRTAHSDRKQRTCFRTEFVRSKRAHDRPSTLGGVSFEFFEIQVALQVVQRLISHPPRSMQPHEFCSSACNCGEDHVELRRDALVSLLLRPRKFGRDRRSVTVAVEQTRMQERAVRRLGPFFSSGERAIRARRLQRPTEACNPAPAATTLVAETTQCRGRRKKILIFPIILQRMASRRAART